MAAQLLPNIIQQFRDANGNVLAGGNVYTYQAGTTTPLATYSDETAVTPNANPIVLDASGSAAIWIGSSAYKFVVKDASGNLIRSVDNVSYLNIDSVDKTKINADVAGAGLSQNGTGALDVQVDNLTTEINGSNEVVIKAGGITADTLPTSSKLEVLSKWVRDYSCPGLVQNIPQVEWSTPTKLSNPGTLPPNGNDCKWSPNGEFLAVASNTTPYITIYQLVNDVLTKLSNPGTLPTGHVFNIAWSPCGDFLACAHQTSPNITIYQRSGNVFTKLSDPVTLPSGVPVYVAFSPNSDFLAVAQGSNNFNIYARSGTTFTDVTSTSTLSGIFDIVAWSPDSYMLAALDFSTNGIDVFTRAGSVFSATTGPSVSSYLGNILDFSFSPDGKFFAVAVNISPYILLFTVTGGVFSQLPNPATLPASLSNCVRWAPNSQYIGVGNFSTPFITIYSVSGTTFTKIANPVSLPAGDIFGMDWSPTKKYLAVAGSVTPFIQVYKTASTLPSNALLWTRGVPSV